MANTTRLALTHTMQTELGRVWYMPSRHTAIITAELADTKGGDLCALVLLSVLVYGPSHFGHLYGEQDTARLVIDALAWLKANVRDYSLSEYRYYTSPGYIWLIKELYPFAERSQLPIAFWLNTINWVCALAFPIPTYLLFRGLLGRLPAVLGVVLLCVTPAFWLAGLYGFPSLPSLFLMVVALLIFDRYLAGSLRGPRIAHWLMVALCLLGATLLKADVWLSCVAMLGIAAVRRQTSWIRLAEIVVLAVCPAIVSLLISRALLADSPTSADYLESWNVQYRPWLSGSLLRPVIKVCFSMGVASSLIFGVCVTRLLRRREFRLLFFLASWAILPIAFWVFRPGDSPRHHLPATVPIALALGWFLAEFRTRRWVPVLMVAALILGNYFALPPSPSTLRPSGRLFESAEMIRQRVSRYHQAAREYAGSRVPRKVILGSFTNPYFDAEVLTSAQSVISVKRGQYLGYDAIEIVHTEGARTFVSTSVRLSPNQIRDAAATFSRSGYRVFSFEYEVGGAAVPNLPQIQKLSGFRPGEYP